MEQAYKNGYLRKVVYKMKNFTEHIRDILKERGITDTDIAAMTPDEAFREVLEWEGLCGYDGAMKRWIKDIYDIEVK